MAIAIPRRLYSVAEYRHMGEAGVFGKEERLELVEGEVVQMSPIGNRHAAAVKRINALFGRLLGNEAVIGVQDPIEVSKRSEPQPDVSVLKWRADYYESRIPTPDDTQLLVEVADSSLPFDRDVKIPMYAKAGIREVWLLDIVGERLWLYAEPLEGTYRMVRELLPHDAIPTQVELLQGVTVRELLP